MKSFPAHYHLVEFIYSPLNFNSREQAYPLVTKQGKPSKPTFHFHRKHHRSFCKIRNIIRERERISDSKRFCQTLICYQRFVEDDQRIQPTRVADQQENSISLATTVIAVTGSAIRGWCTSPRDNNSCPTCDVGHGTPQCRLSSWPHPASFLIPTFIRGWRLHKAVLPISFGI